MNARSLEGIYTFQNIRQDVGEAAVQRLYNGYFDAIGGVAVNGQTIPKWEDNQLHDRMIAWCKAFDDLFGSEKISIDGHEFWLALETVAVVDYEEV